MEHPVLRLGLIGFNAAEITRLAKWLSRTNGGWPVWNIVPHEKADGWWIACRSISAFDNNGLTVQTGQSAQPWLKLNPMEMDRPMAFAGRPPTGLLVTESVDPELESSVRQQLQHFEAWLRPLRGQFALGADLVQREAELKPGIYQVTLQGRLLAVIDLFKWKVGILPTARPVDFDQAIWDHRPPAAGSIPEKFVQMSVSQLMWIYASRTQRDVLPQRYRRQVVHFRRLPRLPVNWMHDEHLLLLREISTRAGTLDDLAQRTGVSVFLLARHLAALYFAGAVTTNSRSAGRLEPKRTPLGMESSQPLQVGTTPDSHGRSALPSGFAGHGRRLLTPQDLTAPAPLRGH